MSDNFLLWLDEHAYRLLARRDYAVRELRERLEQSAAKQFGELEPVQIETLHEFIDTLVQRGHLDEERFVRAWLANRLAYKPRGRYMLLQELLAHGVEKNTAEKIVREEVSPAVERHMATALATKKGKTQKDRKKLVAYLSSKGFSYDVIRQVMDDDYDETGE